MKTAQCCSLIIFLACSLFSCAEKPMNDKAVIILSIGKVTVSHGNKTVPGNINESISKDDIIKTGDNAYLTIQIGDGAIVKINPNTKVTLRSLFNNTEESLYLEHGKVLSKVRKLSKGSGFIIKTPTAIAAVRGTEFSVYYGDGESTTAVKKGRVLVRSFIPEAKQKHAEIREETLVEAGKAGVVTENIATRSITKIEELELEKVAQASYVDDTMTSDTKELNKAGIEQKKTDEDIDEMIKNYKTTHPMSLDEIMKEYKRIDVITLYSGKVIKGVILSRGIYYKVITPTGPVSLNSKEIKRTAVSRQ